MSSKTKSTLSITIFGLFVFFALASGGPDTASNTTVPVSDCMVKPVVEDVLKVTVRVTSLNLIPVHGDVKLHITHQKIINSEACEFHADEIKTSIELNAAGVGTYTGSFWTHDNSQDLFRVQVQFNDVDYELYNDLQVKYYNNSDFEFDILLLPLL